MTFLVESWFTILESGGSRLESYQHSHLIEIKTLITQHLHVYVESAFLTDNSAGVAFDLNHYPICGWVCMYVEQC